MDLYIVLLTIISVALALCAALVARGRRRKAMQAEIDRLELQEKIKQATDLVLKDYKQNYSFLKNALLDKDHYFTHSEMLKFLSENNSILKGMAFLNQNNSLAGLGEDVLEFYSILSACASYRTLHNTNFKKTELEKNRIFFDTLFKYPLDSQQRESIVNLEDNCLVVSSAGSGKTSTMVGKLLYLVQQRRLKPSRILTITYTRKASDELTSRLMGTGLSCMTFHKLAMTIVDKVEKKKPSIADDSLFLKVFYNQLKDKEFKTAVLNYLTDYKSMVKSEHQYTNSFDYYRDRKKYGVVALYCDKNDKLIVTKSEEEKKYVAILQSLA